MTKNLLRVQAPPFIRGINRKHLKSKILKKEHLSRASQFFNLKSQISNLKSIDQEFIEGTSPPIYPWNQSKASQ
ncbi:hypothetical protein QUB21_19635, partial [Microcoleus sp. AT9b-C4]